MFVPTGTCSLDCSKALAEKFIMTSAKLIAPAIEATFAAGFDWCVFPNLNTRGRYRVNVVWSPLRQVMVILCGCFCRCVDMVKSSQYVELANDLEINKAITYLRQRDFNQVGVCHRL